MRELCAALEEKVLRAPHDQDQHSLRLDGVMEMDGQTSSIYLIFKMVTFINVHIRCMFSFHALIGYLATGGRSPTLTHIGNHVHFHINQCYKDDVTLYHSLNFPTPTSRCLVVP